MPVFHILFSISCQGFVYVLRIGQAVFYLALRRGQIWRLPTSVGRGRTQMTQILIDVIISPREKGQRVSALFRVQPSTGIVDPIYTLSLPGGGILSFGLGIALAQLGELE
jgi:hypothetical protein